MYNNYLYNKIPAGQDAVFAARAMLGIDVNDMDKETNANKTKAPAYILSVYPNPTQGKFYIQIIGNTNTQAHIELYDNLGKVALTQTLRLLDNQWTIDASNLNNGFYTFRVFTNNETLGIGKILLNK